MALMAIQQPTQRKRDPLDTVLKGLGIAGSIFGIKANMAKAEQLKEQQALQAKQLADKGTQTEFQNKIAERKIDVDEAKLELAKQQQAFTQAKPKLSKGQESVDQKFATELVNFKLKGGFRNIEKSLEQLTEARDELASGKNLTGFVQGQTKFFREIFNPESIAVQEAIEEVTQKNLKLILGGQFSEREGKQLIERAFNPRLSEAENFKRVDRLVRQIAGAAQAKREAIEFFEANNQSLLGFEGKLFTSANEFLAEVPESIKGRTRGGQGLQPPSGTALATPMQEAQQQVQQAPDLGSQRFSNPEIQGALNFVTNPPAGSDPAQVQQIKDFLERQGVLKPQLDVGVESPRPFARGDF